MSKTFFWLVLILENIAFGLFTFWNVLILQISVMSHTTGDYFYLLPEPLLLLSTYIAIREFSTTRPLSKNSQKLISFCLVWPLALVIFSLVMVLVLGTIQSMGHIL